MVQAGGAGQLNAPSEDLPGVVSAALHTLEVQLQKLESYCRALALALVRAGLSPTNALQVLREGVAGACAQCGACATGEDLEALSQPASPNSSATVQRLRLGDCSHPGCKSFLYRLSFQDLPGVDWNLILPQVEGIGQEVRQAELTAEQTRKRGAKLRLAARLAAGFSILLALLVIRQWYYGGSIPLIREPEKFKVDVLPSDARGHH